MLQIEGVHFFVYHSINGMNFFCITSISDQACHSLWVSPEVVVTMKFIVRILKHFEIEKGTIAKKMAIVTVRYLLFCSEKLYCSCYKILFIFYPRLDYRLHYLEFRFYCRRPTLDQPSNASRQHMQVPSQPQQQAAGGGEGRARASGPLSASIRNRVPSLYSLERETG